MGIPTKVVAKPGHVVLIEDIPGKPRIRVRAGSPVNLLQHYTMQEIASSNGITSSVVNGLLIPHAEAMDLPKEKEFGVKIPKGRLVSKTYQTVGIRKVKGGQGTTIETVRDEADTAEVRKKIAGVSAGAGDADETAKVDEVSAPEVIVKHEGEDDETAAPVSTIEKRKLDAAREKRESSAPTVVTKGTPHTKRPAFSVKEFIAFTEDMKVQRILDGKVKNPKNLKSIRDRKINNGKHFSVRVRSAAGKILKHMEKS